MDFFLSKLPLPGLLQHKCLSPTRLGKKTNSLVRQTKNRPLPQSSNMPTFSSIFIPTVGASCSLFILASSSSSSLPPATARKFLRVSTMLRSSQMSTDFFSVFSSCEMRDTVQCNSNFSAMQCRYMRGRARYLEKS